MCCGIFLTKARPGSLGFVVSSEQTGKCQYVHEVSDSLAKFTEFFHQALEILQRLSKGVSD